MKEVKINVPVKFDSDKFVDEFLIHNDLPAQADIYKAEREEKMIITFLVLPEWIEIWDL